MSFIASAIIGGAAGIGGALISSKATKKASNAAGKAATDNNALQREIYDKNLTNAKGYVDRGELAGSNINALLGLGGDQTAANRAFGQYRDSTGYQFQLDEGNRAMDRTAAARGGLQSGAALKAGQRYGQQLGSSAFQTYLNNLYQQQGVGLSATNAVAGVGTNFANAVGANNNNAADATGNAALANAGNMNSLLDQLAQTGSYAFGRSRVRDPEKNREGSSQNQRASALTPPTQRGGRPEP